MNSKTTSKYKLKFLMICALLTLGINTLNAKQTQLLFNGSAIEDQILAYYPLNNHANDYSGNNNHGLVIDATGAKDLRGQTNKAMSFDGIDDNITVPSIGDWGAEVTFSFWAFANASGVGQNHILIGSRNYGFGSTVTNFFIALNSSGNLRFGIMANGDNSHLQSTQVFPTNRWVHVVAEWSQLTQSMTMYWDGELEETGSISTDEPRYLDADIGIGSYCHGCGNSTYFDGKIDELRIHSRALSQGEISNLSGLIAEYRLNDNVLDNSGNERHGDRFGATKVQGLFGGEINSAYAFDGVNDVINSPGLGDWGDELGFSLWFQANTESAGKNQVLLGSRLSGSGETPTNLALKISPSSELVWKIYSDGSDSTVVSHVDAVTYGRWNHVACDWSQKTGLMRLFLNGELLELGVVGDVPRYFGNGLGVGNFNKNYDRTVAPFHGIIDQVEYYNRVFTDDEVLRLADLVYKSHFE